MSILRAQNLEIGYTSTLLGPFDLAIPRGSFVLIEGPNGCGKSVFLKTLIGLESPRAGSFEWEVDAEALRFVPQTRTVDTLLPATVRDVMELGFQRGSGWGSFRRRPDPDQIARALDAVGMHKLLKKLFRELSEGQKQLIMLARALLAEPAVILLDEPSASMDPAREKLAVDVLLGEQRARDCTILMIAHGSQPAQQAADYVLKLDYDKSVEFRPNNAQNNAEEGGAQEELCGKP